MNTSTPTAIRSTTGNPPQREYTRNVPKHFDGGDIDERGHWVGAAMCCLECRETHPMRTSITATYLLANLSCAECSEPFAEYWV